MARRFDENRSIAFIFKTMLLKYSTAVMAWVLRYRLPPIPSVAAIVVKENQLLLVNRSDGNGYCLPGGIMHWNETIADSLKREVKEETGLEIEILKLFNNYSGPERDSRISAICMTYIASCLGGELTCSSEGVPMWIPLSEALYLDFAFDHESIIKDYLSTIDERNLKVTRTADSVPGDIATAHGMS